MKAYRLGATPDDDAPAALIFAAGCGLTDFEADFGAAARSRKDVEINRGRDEAHCNWERMEEACDDAFGKRLRRRGSNRMLPPREAILSMA